MKKILFIVIVFLSGCATTTPITAFKDIENVSALLKKNITVDQSTKNDVMKLLGKPDIASVYESSSVENQISKVPLLDQLGVTKPFDVAIFPHETWTYIHMKDPSDEKTGQYVKVLGISVFAKNLKTTTVMFNKEGKVLGYNVINHYVE